MLPSTNTELARRASAGAAAGAVLLAEQQTAGRGRTGRAWLSPPRAGLALSALIRPQAPPGRWSWLPLIVGLATAEAVEAETGVAARVKWPNDVTLGPGRRKAVGVLAEAGAGWAVLGVGVNVDQERSELPQRPDVTSLRLEGAEPDRTALAAALLERLEERVRLWEKHDGDPAFELRDAYRARCDTLGRRISGTLPDGSELRGRAQDVDEDGRLLIDADDDGVRAMAAGDIRHVLPAPDAAKEN